MRTIAGLSVLTAVGVLAGGTAAVAIGLAGVSTGWQASAALESAIETPVVVAPVTSTPIASTVVAGEPPRVSEAQSTPAERIPAAASDHTVENAPLPEVASIPTGITPPVSSDITLTWQWPLVDLPPFDLLPAPPTPPVVIDPPSSTTPPVETITDPPIETTAEVPVDPPVDPPIETTPDGVPESAEPIG